MQPTLQGLLIRRCRHGIHLINRDRNLVIADCHIYDNSGVGVFFDRVNLHQTNIHGCHISYCKQGGIKIIGSETRNLQICGNDIEYNYDACFNIWEIKRQDLEPYLDQAEYWLRSWVAPAVRILTLGYVNPRRMVHEEVLKALTSASVDMNKMMWRWALQIGVRISFGLTLWFTWYLAVHAPA